MSAELKCVFATLPKTTRGVPIVMGADPKGKNILYTSGNSVIIRDVQNPSIADVYTQHSVATTVAKYSPSGFYIASADVAGKVRIWDTTQKEHILKNEFQPFSGPIKDLAWSSDNQRIVVVGEGREKFGHVFNAETGTSVGEMMGHSKALNSVDFKPSRPFRIVTGSEDKSLGFFLGPPFKFEKTLTPHTNFVNCVRYAPNGEVFVSGGAEGKAYVFEGKSGDIIGEVGSPAHKGGIYALSFSPDSKEVMTVSADKTAKIWNVESRELVQEFVLGTTILDMQVGCIWQADQLLTVSLSGFINYLDRSNNSSPSRLIKGHNRPITSIATTEDRSQVYSASSDGAICRWDAATGANERVQGKGHSNQVQDITICEDTLVSVGIDDVIIFTSLASNEFGTPTKLPSQPKKVRAAPGGLAVVACLKDIVMLRGGEVVYTLKADFEPLSVAIHPGMTQVAIGAADKKIHLYTLSNSDTLQEDQTLDQLGDIMDLQYSPDGAYLASVNSDRKVMLYRLPDYTKVINSEWSAHTAKINSIDWAPDSQHLVTGSLDTNIIVWNPEHKMKHLSIKAAHPMSQVVGVRWLDNNTVVSAGHDSCVKTWSITHKQ